MKAGLLALVLTVCCVSCASKPSSSGLIAAGGIGSAANLPGGGVLVVVGLAMDLAEWVSGSGKPKIGSVSPKALEVLISTPVAVFDEKGNLTKWIPKKDFKDKKSNKMFSEDNTPPELLAMAVLISVAQSRFTRGDFGDGNEESLKRKVDAWRDKQLVVAEYRGTLGSRVVIVSNERDPGKVYLYEEWESMHHETPQTPPSTK